MSVKYQFRGNDALVQNMFLLVLFSSVIAFHWFILTYMSWKILISNILFCLVVSFSFRNQIIVTDNQVIITKYFLLIPYKQYTGKEIDFLCFSGNWADSDDACGITVTLNGKEIHIGSPKTMYELHMNLSPYAKDKII